MIWNFLPRYSPDGSHLAYYAAPLKPGQKAGRYANDYAIVPGEDGPAPVAEAVEIISAEQQKVTRLTVPGAKVANFCWGADGSHLAFAAGKVKSSPAGQAGPRGRPRWNGKVARLFRRLPRMVMAPAKA